MNGCYQPPPSRWPHQQKCFDEITTGIDQLGWRSMCVTSPTGGGKSVMMNDIIKWGRSKSWRVCLYTNRRMLTEQLHKTLGEEGIAHGVRAADWDMGGENEPVQICSIQTENARVKSGQWESPKADLVLVDEAHVNKGEMATKILTEHRMNGARVIGYTATPVDICYDRLIVAGTNSELRKCGALLMCKSYGPEEPDLRHIKRQASGEFSENDVRKVMKVQTIVGKVLEWYGKLNPNQLPSILFAPGVQESIFFVNQLNQAGIVSAHIDGEHCYLGENDSDGLPVLLPSTQELRLQIADDSKCGRIKVVCNRFVMREGINWPWLYHCIMATAMGGVTSYLQSVGRLLRSYPGLDHVVMQDHGGNYIRHGSPNDDRIWDMESTNYRLAAEREERIREKKEPEPIICPQCSGGRSAGPKCPHCGFVFPHCGRFVRQTSGDLKYMKGSIYPPRKVSTKPDTQKKWESCYYRAKKCGMSFRQAEALFVRENHYYPPRDLPLMPRPEHQGHWYDKVQDVPRMNLNPTTP